jgi:hypothetical protein
LTAAAVAFPSRIEALTLCSPSLAAGYR